MGLGIVVAGVVLGGVWRLVVPVVQEWGDTNELTVAADGTLALVGMVGGLVTGLVLVIRPGRVPWRRLLVGVATGGAAGIAATATAWALTGWRPAAWGVVTLWPVTSTAVVFVSTCVRAAFAPVPPHDPAGVGGPPVDPVPPGPQQYPPGAGIHGADPAADRARPEPSSPPGWGPTRDPDEAGPGHRPGVPRATGWAPPNGDSWS